ncbi:MAG TPA: mechanosensitive ion channel [Thiotrichaceae bacterium]|jgi:small-conductance mechanosensitive channel|nr:mechanosensitive ion channel [Thiotrichaceae bacterium]HIM07359.1 mechanosensitive ion channel [Gammaproteobacteria bacterium]
MNKYFDYATMENFFLTIDVWINEHVLIISNLIQLCLIVFTLLISWYLAPGIKEWREKGGVDKSKSVFRFIPTSFYKYQSLITSLVLPITWLLTLSSLLLIGAAIETSHHLIKIAVSLLAAWVVINMTTGMLRNKALSKFVAVVIWTVAVLNILNLIDPVTNVLDSIGLTLGGLRLTALTVIEGIFILTVLLWLAIFVSQFVEQQIRKSTDITPSVKVLISKLVKISLIIIAVVASMSSVGIDLTAFAIFSGAVGVGIGLGLQKSIANLFSGLLLLMDKSIKPGDLITVGDTYGVVESLNARYASVKRMDGTEHLIPNENLISQEVINWTHTDKLIRPEVDVGVHYQADVRIAMALCIEAGKEVERVLDSPEPEVLLIGFGDNAVDLKLRFWIKDPEKGVLNVKSEILLKIWDKFHEHNIEIPYPQRDLHIRSSVIDINPDSKKD